MAENKRSRESLGKLERKHHFTLNPYPQLRLSKCPDCGGKTGQKKIPLIVHVDPAGLILLNYTNRYCKACDMLMGHKHEIEHFLVEAFSQLNPNAIGNDYLIFGTVEKPMWRKNMDQQQSGSEILDQTHDFISYQELRMTMGGWFKEEQEPPVVEPPPSTEWIK